MGSLMRRVSAFGLLAVIGVFIASAAVAQDKPVAEMVRIEGASFTMGRNGGLADERPAHRVTVRTFFIDRMEVTNAAFANFLNARGGPVDGQGRRLFDWDDGDAQIHKRGRRYVADPGFERHPVVEPSWYGALEFCRWRGKRLASEAEWELAARGTVGRTYPWGDRPTDSQHARFGVGWGETLQVGSLRPGATPEGVLNMAGNVHEWVSSLYKPYPYNAADGRENPLAAGERVTRGGEFADNLARCGSLAQPARGPPQYRFPLRALRPSVLKGRVG
jgi:iron(II)-dependent oxidoreductase